MGPIERASLSPDTSSRFHLKMETEFSVRNIVFLIIGRTTDNVQNCDSYINIPFKPIDSINLLGL
jgi:hypothetical protein